MKKFIKIFSLATLATLFLASCEKEENQVSFEGGNNPSLSANVSNGATISISKPAKDFPAVTFNWTNPDYRLNTGISSQSVSYAIQMKERDSAKFITVDVVAADLSKAYTQGQLNDILFREKVKAGLQIPENEIRPIQVRIVSFLGDTYYDGNATNLVSEDTLSFVVDKVYSVYPDLWITGEATAAGWTNAPPADQKFNYDPVTKNHTLQIQLTGDIYYKFLTVNGQWQPQWGVAAGVTTGALNVAYPLTENPGGGSDPESIKAPPTTGVYTITVNLEAKTAIVTQ